MNNLTKTLLGGVAITAMTALSASAAKLHPAFHVTALHSGKQVNKTKLHNNGATHVTYTFGVYTYVSAGSAGTPVNLTGTFYKWNNSGTICSDPKEKIKVDPKKTKYAKIGTTTETYSFGCASGPTTFYGDTYNLKRGVGAGVTDFFVSTLTGKFHNMNTDGARGTSRYIGNLHLEVNVTID